jgi:hypothetical protein
VSAAQNRADPHEDMHIPGSGKQRPTFPGTAAALVVLVLLALLLTHGWADYLLVILALAVMTGSYWLRHRIRSDAYRQLRTRTRRDSGA